MVIYNNNKQIIIVINQLTNKIKIKLNKNNLKVLWTNITKMIHKINLILINVTRNKIF